MPTRHSNPIARNIVANLYWRWRLARKYLNTAIKNNFHETGIMLNSAHEAEAWSAFWDNYRYLKGIK